jgi:hypothetical protein
MELSQISDAMWRRHAKSLERVVASAHDAAHLCSLLEPLVEAGTRGRRLVRGEPVPLPGTRGSAILDGARDPRRSHRNQYVPFGGGRVSFLGKDRIAVADYQSVIRVWDLTENRIVAEAEMSE